jgi:translation initiation factor 1
VESEELDFKDILRHLDRESAHFIVRLEKHHSGRFRTIVQPHDLIKDSIDLPGLALKLKETLGTSGEVENGRIILHGDQRDKVRDELAKLGVSKDRVEII